MSPFSGENSQSLDRRPFEVIKESSLVHVSIENLMVVEKLYRRWSEPYEEKTVPYDKNRNAKNRHTKEKARRNYNNDHADENNRWPEEDIIIWNHTILLSSAFYLSQKITHPPA
jgi:hypothetical protein